MQRFTYIKAVLAQHLLDGKGTYKQILETTTRSTLFMTKAEIASLTSGTLPPIEEAYFLKILLNPDNSFHDPVFYEMSKVHKGNRPCHFSPLSVNTVVSSQLLLPTLISSSNLSKLTSTATSRTPTRSSSNFNSSAKFLAAQECSPPMPS